MYQVSLVTQITSIRGDEALKHDYTKGKGIKGEKKRSKDGGGG